MERFGAKGLWLVCDTNNEIVGLAGWRAENLIARIDDFLVFPFELYTSAGRILLESIENAARELQCEVSMLFVPLRASQRMVDFYESCGYKRAAVEGLPRVWQESAQEAAESNRYLMLKQLREDLVTRPM
jgi:N-acetylglutamate synthase-like GNAT family acetyltransferase